MGKKGIFVVFILMSLLIFVSCGEEESYQTSVALGEVTVPAEEKPVEEVAVTIFYGNDMADSLITQELLLPTLSEKVLINELAKVNIVSLDTKVNKLEIQIAEEKTILYLDLSKEFKEYISLMGTAGEYIIVGSVVNTFLRRIKGMK